ncbi:hypothetical protein [Paenibacillus hexagrammi]|uniref:Uncharacterized protein n=1 Tax=Paenibacillus hexagrammi TaxID=2908839 RepID=A0ABY3SNG8_9BACL|nr:hypothetical protein [Paenibacillus sp. YPD9-1]UJF35542.1 hypothetical protein L0M14_10835 [Paenibacillus sp. YPD9-1]
MKLFEEIDPTQSDDEDSNSKKTIHINQARPQFENVVVNKSANQQLSSLAQFFIAPNILVDSNAIWHIPVSEEVIYNQVTKEIAPHFEKTSKVTNGNQVQIMLQNISESSRIMFMDLFSSNKINPIVLDLYSQATTSKQIMNNRVKSYKVNLQEVPRLIEHDIVHMWNFFESTFIKNGEYLIMMPNNWKFDDAFRERISVQAFCERL